MPVSFSCRRESRPVTRFVYVDWVWNVTAHAQTRFSISAKRTSPFKSAGASVQSTTGSRVVRISGSNAGYTMFRGSVKGTGYPLHSPVSPSLLLSCVTVCHHVSTGLYITRHISIAVMYTTVEFKFSEVIGIFLVVGLQIITLLTDILMFCCPCISV